MNHSIIRVLEQFCFNIKYWLKMKSIQIFRKSHPRSLSENIDGCKKHKNTKIFPLSVTRLSGELRWVMRGSENVSPIIHLLLSNWKIISEIQHYTENWPRNGYVRATILRFVSALSSSNNISSLLCQNTFVANIWTRTQSLLKQQKYLPWGAQCDFYYRHTTKHWRSIKCQY